MVFIIVKLITILFALYLLFTFFSYASLFLNLVILIALYFLISKDLKDKENHKYYLASLLLTAIFFILSTTPFINNILILAEKMLLSLPIVAVILVYLFANLIAFSHKYYHQLKKRYKR